MVSPLAPESAFTVVLATGNGVGAAEFTIQALRPGIRAGVEGRDQSQRGDERDESFLKHRCSPGLAQVHTVVGVRA